MPKLTGLDHEPYHGISTRSNAESVELSRRPITRETSPKWDGMNFAQRNPGSFNLKEYVSQASVNRERQIRGWINSHGRVNIVERRDVIDMQLHAAKELASELAKNKTGEQNSGSVKGLKDKAKRQDLGFVGSWVDEKDKRSYT